MKCSVCILNYGSGNVRSVYNMVSSLEEDVIISNDPSDIKQATHLILPGVGAFETSMQKIRENLPLSLIEEEVKVNSKPFLGICVGMQVLAEKGHEFGEHPGLGWIKGTVKRIESGQLPLPHVGWNNIEVKKPHPLLHNLSNVEDFYFVHSYAFAVKNKENIVATTEYHTDFCSIVADKNIWGVQFHPEKSQGSGKKLMQNFLSV